MAQVARGLGSTEAALGASHGQPVNASNTFFERHALYFTLEPPYIDWAPLVAR